MADSLARSIALAVPTSHPEIAINIWKACALNKITRTKAKAYRNAGKYLRQLRKVYEQHQRLNEWQKYIHGLQTIHKRKIRLQEVLNDLLKSK